MDLISRESSMADAFEKLEEALREAGPLQAIERLCADLRERKDYHGLFYALLLRKRHELGLPAVQLGGGDNIPPDRQELYEEAIRLAGRTVGQLYLDQGDLINAWPFFRMIGEPGPVAEALERNAEPEDGEVYQQLVDVALHQGAHPKKGFDMVVKRYGICSAITMFGQGLPVSDEVRQHCIKRLVRALYEELQARLHADVKQRSAILIPGASAEPGDDDAPKARISELMEGRDWLFEDEAYHIDTSHLSAITQFSINLPPCEELNLAIELCEYGKRLSPRLQYAGDPPFENQFADYQVYLKAIAGQEVESAISHFRAKAEQADPNEVGTFPAQVLVNLLTQMNRPAEAVAAYARFLGNADARQLACPSLQELCEKAGDYRPLIEVSRRRGDLVNFTAGLLQTRQS